MSSRTRTRSGQNGYAIRAIREREGLTTDELAAAAKITAPHMRNIELEHKTARPETLALIARALRCPLAAIVRGDSSVAAQLTTEHAVSDVA